MKRLAMAALLAAGALALAATSASADFACNDEGECWHIKGKAEFYKPEHGIHIHPDNWKWGEKGASTKATGSGRAAFGSFSDA